MSDLIDRRQAMDAIIGCGKYLWERFHEPSHLAVMLDAIENVPSAQQWIPVSEGLPKPGEEVFVYLWGDVPYLANVDGEGQWETDHFYLDADEAPKAWQQLPAPWKGGNDG